MSKPKPIQITIPNPCTQSWDEMTPQGQGRHCANCQKVVTDFTGWSDTALYEFLLKNKESKLCGMFKVEQLERDIIPCQHNSTLYKLFLSLGLTLMLIQVPVQPTFAKVPFTSTQIMASAEDKRGDETNGEGYVKIKGVVLNLDNNPVIGAILYVVRYDIPAYVFQPAGGAITDITGSFNFQVPIGTISSGYLVIVNHLYRTQYVPLNSLDISEDTYIEFKLDSVIVGLFFPTSPSVPLVYKPIEKIITKGQYKKAKRQ